MDVLMSNFLNRQKAAVKELVQKLSRRFSYVSVLGTDTLGKRYDVKKTGVSIKDSMWTERGFVARIYNGVNYFEYSFNDISGDNVDEIAKRITEIALDSLNNMKGRVKISSYPLIQEKEIEKSYTGQVGIDPADVSDSDILKKLNLVKDEGLNMSDIVVDIRATYECVHVSKIFISTKKDLQQSYIWSQAYIVPFVRENGKQKFFFKVFSGLKGVELIDEVEPYLRETIETAKGLLNADNIEPGEYDVICSPEITGLIAHEAFGHGVEMDMFVKRRAKATEYIGKPVASKYVTMHDGASAAKEVSSYMFDDEGTLAHDTVIIDKGILKTGISDLLSSLKLKTEPTGNGKRESFERKAYSRMTNTFFSGGNDKLEDMISSIKYGYFLDGAESGMEDPKNWGIQCMLFIGREIKDGKFTGRIVSPVIMTGYVPDLLKSISMVSENVVLFGSGACGKGHKEYVKVSDGGPYIKTKARLG